MRLSTFANDVRMRLESVEVEVLGDALDDLLGALDDIGPGDQVWERLYPPAFDDPEAAEEFREMANEDLDNARRERLSACRGELSSAPTRRRHTELTLEPEALERWIMALNDLRLALGTAIGVQPDFDHGSDDRGVDPSGPQAESRALYQWLTAVQDGLVTHAMRS